jgi:Protein of unknown function (DUF3300)
MISRVKSTTLKSVATLCFLLFPLSLSFGQGPMGPPPASPNVQQTAPLLSPQQLDNLVAPVALYPDPVLSTVLAASTYPLEVVEAQQWLQQNSNLRGAPLMDAAKQQEWDASVQAVVAFPDALRLLSNDIRWTTDLGNAFLAQQADVMTAVQRMRARAQANGKLTTTPQQVVTTDAQNAIEIQPANPQVVYVPVYQPAYVWGPPVWGAYPDLWYPSGFGFGFGFGPGCYIGALFPGWGGWGGWGWGFGWGGHSLFVNGGFFNRYGFRGGFGGRFGGRSVWAHEPGHRMGVPYPNRAVASQFNSGRFSGGGMNRGGQSGGYRSGSQFNSGNRSYSGQSNGGRFNAGQRGTAQSANFGAGANGSRSFAGNRMGSNSNQSFNRQSSPSYGARSGSQSYRAPSQSYRGGYGAASSYRSAPSYNQSYARSYSAPRAQSFSASRSSSAPHFSGGGGHSSFSGGGGHGGGGGHSSGGGGGHSSGGGHGGGGGGHHR